MIGAIARRVAQRVVVRGTVALVAVSPEAIPLVDLRGSLPSDGQYSVRDMSNVCLQVIHHTATTGSTIRSLAEFHVAERGWPAIGYHFAIGYDGKCYLLNDVDRRTNHAAGVNSISVGVALVGSFQHKAPPQEMVVAASMLSEFIADRYGIDQVVFHRDTKRTLCPGDSAVKVLQYLKH